MKHILKIIALVGIVASTSACSDDFDPFKFMNPEFDEGLNLHDMSGTITIDASLTASVGMIYIGLYSGTNDTIGYPMPLLAPGSGDAFPYGGTTVGTFEARDTTTGERDPDLVCAVVNSREFYPGDNPGELKADFVVRQFPFYPGTVVWAFADSDYSTCDSTLGFTDPELLDDSGDPVTYGTNFPDVLNKPQNYIGAGDYVTTQTQTLSSVSDLIAITIDCEIGVDC